MISRTTLRAVFISLLTVSLTPFIHAQATGSISGTVSDASGGPVSGAKVTVTAETQGISRISTTDGSGHYLVPLLPVANYTVRAELAGFQTSEAKDIVLQVDQSRELNFTLAVASVNTTVEVTTTEVAVETSSPALGQVINSQQVADLPLNGRDFVQLATL